MEDSPVPLIPQRAKYKQVGDAARILTLELKFDAESGYELLKEEENPALWKHLQETAVEAFRSKKMYTNFMGCDIDMRIGQDGRAYGIEVDPLPVFFYPTGSQLEDTDVTYGFRAVVNPLITNYFLKHPSDREPRFIDLASIFDQLLTLSNSTNEVPEIDVLGLWNDIVLDLGCGTGSVGRALHADPRNRSTRLRS